MMLQIAIGMTRKPQLNNVPRSWRGPCPCNRGRSCGSLGFRGTEPGCRQPPSTCPGTPAGRNRGRARIRAARRIRDRTPVVERSRPAGHTPAAGRNRAARRWAGTHRRGTPPRRSPRAAPAHPNGDPWRDRRDWSDRSCTHHMRRSVRTISASVTGGGHRRHGLYVGTRYGTRTGTASGSEPDLRRRPESGLDFRTHLGRTSTGATRV